MKANHITQINGTSGQLIGVVPVQTNGTVTLKIAGDTLQFRDETFFGLETKEVFIPIEDVRAIEIGEGCTWWLFWLGILFIFTFFIGIIFIVLAFIVKQRYMIIYTSKLNLIIFYKKSEKVGSFRTAVLEARQSKPATIPKQPTPPPPPRPLEN